MSAKGFLNLSRTDSLKAYKAVVENSNSKWIRGLKIAKEEEFGTATSIAVSSVEELIKAIIIAMNGHGFKFRKAPMMEKLFKNHQIRYVVAYAMFVVNIASEELGKLVQWINQNPQDSLVWLFDLIKNQKTKSFKLDAYARLKFRAIKREFNWFEKIDTFRQEGMYTDFDGVLKSPLNVSQETFNETITRLSKVRQVGMAIIETLESKDEVYVNHYANMVKQFDSENYYEKINSALKSMKRPNVPFESIKSFFT